VKKDQMIQSSKMKFRNLFSGVFLIACCLSWGGVLARTNAPPSLLKLESTIQTPAGPTQPIEIGISHIAKDLHLSGRQTLILQPLLNELSILYSARIAWSYQHGDYMNTLNSKLETFVRSIEILDNEGLEVIRRYNRYQETILKQWLHGLECGDPKNTVKGVWRPPAPPYGWLVIKEFPDKMKNLVAQNQDRESQWIKGETTCQVNWPGYDFRTIKALEQAAKDERERIRKLDDPPESRSYEINYPVLGSVKKQQLTDQIVKTREKIEELRATIDKGDLVMQSDKYKDRVCLVPPVNPVSSDDLTGWVTKQQILDKIDELEKKKQDIQAKFNSKKLRIRRSHFRGVAGWADELEYEKKIEDIRQKVKEVSDQIGTGEYPVHFPSPFATYTHNQLEEKIEQIRKHMEEIDLDSDYRVPVNQFGLMNKKDIEKALQNKNLSESRRYSLKQGSSNIGKAKSLEKQYLQIELSFYQFLLSKVPNSIYTHLGCVEGKKVPAAMPFLLYHDWDCSQLRRMSTQFHWELGYYVHYYNLKIDHLKKCLELF
jgi:hypothetical protein